MIRNQLNFRNVLQFQTITSQKFFSAQPALAENDSKLNDELAKAKPFDQIPAITKFGLIRAFLPGGRYFKLSLGDMHKQMHSDFGNIMKMPALFDKPTMLMVFDPNDIEKVFRTEGIWPNRMELKTLSYYRKQIRPDIYGEVGGLFAE